MPDLRDKLKYLNNFLSKLNLNNYKSLTDEDIETLNEEYLDSEISPRAAHTERIMKLASGNSLGGNSTYNIPENADPLTYLFLSYSVFSRNFTEEEKAVANKHNLNVIEQFSASDLSAAEKKALFDKKFRSLLGIDFSKIAAGSAEDRITYLTSRINDVVAFTKVPELIEAYKKIPGYNTKTVEALEEKLGMFKAAADFLDYASIYAHPGYSIAEKLTQQQLERIKENEEFKHYANLNNNDEEWTSNLEFIDTLSRHHEKTASKESFFALEDIFKELAKQKILDFMDEGIAYAAFDEENKHLDMYTAAQMMKEGKTVIFRERTSDAVQYAHNNTKEAPKEEFTGRSLEYHGAELTKVVEQPNPVLATLAKLTPEEELTAARLWFDDMLVNIKEAGEIDPEQKYDTFRFKQVDVGGSRRQNVTKNEFAGIPQPVDPLNFDLDSSTALKDFNDEQKLTMFKAAREGRLILNAPSMYLPGARGIYVNNEGKFGITAPISELTTENNLLNVSIKNDNSFLERSVPNADNALQIATQLGDFARASNNDLGINSDLTDDLRLKNQKEKIYETTLLKDIAENPQFYREKNIRDARIQLINNYITVASSQNLAEDDPLVIEAQNHDLTAYKGALDTIAPLINNSLIAPVDPNSKEKMSPDDAIRKYADMGLITFGKERNIPIMNEKGDMPWDLVDRINYQLGNGVPVYITTASDGKIRDYKLTSNGETIKVKEVMPLKVLNKAQEEIARLRDQLNQTGYTKGDSEEFKKLSNFLNSKSMLSVPETKADFMKAMKELSRLSFDYSFAKLDQSQNTRRMTRFEAACRLQNVADSFIYGDSPLDSKELSKRIIASKATKQLLTNLSKSKDTRAKAFAQAALESKTAFNEQVDILMGSGSFISHFDNLGAERLAELSKNSASALAKQVVDAKSGYKHDIIGECLDKIEASNITIGSDTAIINSYISDFMAANDSPEMSSQEVATEVLNGNPYHKSAYREGLSSLAICSMLSKGCSFEDAFNPKVFTEEKKRTFNEVAELLKEKTPEHTKTIAGFYKAAMDASLDYFNKKAANIDFSNPAWMASGDNWKLQSYGLFMQSVIQEYDNIDELKTEYYNLCNSPGKNDGKTKALERADLQVYINDFIKKSYSSLKMAYELENGINDPLSEKTPIQSAQVPDQFVQSKIFRESYKQVQEQHANMKPTEIIKQIELKMQKAGTLSNNMQSNTQIDKKIGNVLKDPGKARALGKDYIDGKLDKSFSVKNNPENPAQYFKTAGFVQALDSIKPVKLPSSVINSAPRKKEEIVVIK